MLILINCSLLFIAINVGEFGIDIGEDVVEMLSVEALVETIVSGSQKDTNAQKKMLLNF